MILFFHIVTSVGIVGVGLILGLMVLDVLGDEKTRPDLSFKFVSRSLLISFCALFVGIIGLSIFLPTPKCETVAYRYYSCGRGGTCKESICLDEYHIKKENDKIFPKNTVEIIGQNKITSTNIIFGKILDRNYIGVL